VFLHEGLYLLGYSAMQSRENQETSMEAGGKQNHLLSHWFLGWLIL
jgi:hypothetical protein